MKSAARFLCILGAGLAIAAPAAARPSPSSFTALVDNPWFPLNPGTTLVYRGVDNGRPSREVIMVTRRTKLIQGVPCVVVDDRVYLDGRLRERTTDWYSQDRAGNVWYFGEATAELDGSGHVTSTGGSWQAGRDGAIAGIYMPAKPTVGQTGRQEYLEGQAEDHFRVVDVHARVSVPYVSSRAALMTEEWSPLEPGVLEHKLYVRGVGIVLEQTVQGGADRNELVGARHAA
jgi:hypothetical protein